MIDISSVSMFGTYLTCRGKQAMSVNTGRGKVDLALGRVEFWV